jgi:hypothetical protein
MPPARQPARPEQGPRWWRRRPDGGSVPSSATCTTWCPRSTSGRRRMRSRHQPSCGQPACGCRIASTRRLRFHPGRDWNQRRPAPPAAPGDGSGDRPGARQRCSRRGRVCRGNCSHGYSWFLSTRCSRSGDRDALAVPGSKFTLVVALSTGASEGAARGDGRTLRNRRRSSQFAGGRSAMTIPLLFYGGAGGIGAEPG